MRFTILGSGSAGGVPLYGCECDACRRAALLREHRRQSACALVETADTRLLIDAGLPDLGDRFPAGRLDAILLTHYHMDHVQGLFRIRWGAGPALPVLGPDDPQGCDDLFRHPGILDFGRKTRPFETFAIGELSMTPLPLNHSRTTLGYQLEHKGARVAYLTDTCGLPPATLEWLQRDRPDLLVLDCSFAPRAETPRNHNDLTRALAICEEIDANHSLLTHIDHRLDDWLLRNPGFRLPRGVGLASDMQQVELVARRRVA
jgi:phosphoribosyl 1,2-cyclic phosphate phosphodiesterase